MTRQTTTIRQTITIAVALVLAGALGATSPTLARGVDRAARLGPRPADATGYFYYPGNYVDDGYVYDPAAVRGRSHAHVKSSRHRHRSS
jgi:hypothetical protein